MIVALTRNRVWRPFTGGRLLDEFQGVESPTDGHYPEQWVASTVAAADGSGLSRREDGKLLRDLAGRELNILVKLLHSETRLMLQVHPDRERAKRYFASAYGKTEAWYILGTRRVGNKEPYVLLGFREGVTKARWRERFLSQDVAGMESCLHRIQVRVGDALFVPAGAPHAMGSGVFFAEVQEPTDITLRVERTAPDGRQLSDEELHQGAGFDALFDCFDYDGTALREALRRYRIPVGKDGEIVSARQTPFFSMRLLDGPCTLGVEGYAVLVALSGASRGREPYTDESLALDAGRWLVCQGRRHTQPEMAVQSKEDIRGIAAKTSEKSFPAASVNRAGQLSGKKADYMLVPLRAILEACDAHDFAQGAFNVNAVALAKAAIKVREMFRSAAVLQGADLANGFMGGHPDFLNATLEDKKSRSEKHSRCCKNVW